MRGLVSGQTERRQRVGHDIRGRRQIFAGGRRQIHDAVNTGDHLAGFPACHGHVVHGVGSFRSGELGLCAHLPGLFPERVKLLPGRAGHCLDLRHGFIEVSGGLNRRRGDAQDGSRHLCAQVLAHIRNLAAELLHLLAGVLDLHQRGCGCPGLGFQVFQRFLSLDDLPLNGVVLIRRDGVAKLVGHSLSLLLQGGKVALCFLDLRLQAVVLLLGQLPLVHDLLGFSGLILEVFQLILSLCDLGLQLIVLLL